VSQSVAPAECLQTLVRQVLASEADADLGAVSDRYRKFHEKFLDCFGFKDDAESRAVLEQALREIRKALAREGWD
jgi:hypothetical protein